MKKFIIFFLIFTLLYLSNVKCQTVPTTAAPPSVFCCRDRSDNQEKCLSIGECCDGYWYPRCNDFTAWLEPKTAAFVVGQKTPINLYIENTGVYTDSYDITYTVSDATLVLVDITGISSVKNVVPEEVRLVNPMITVIRKDHGTVDFIINSDSGLPPQSVTLTILESELPMSLPEFGLYGMSGMIILAGIIYFLIKWKH